MGEAFNPERLTSAVTEPQFLRAAQQMRPGERSEIAQDFFEGLRERGLSPSWLQRMLGLGSDDPRRANPNDVARLSEYARQNHPEVFRRVVPINRSSSAGWTNRSSPHWSASSRENC